MKRPLTLTFISRHREGVYPSLHLHSVVHSTVHCTRAVTSLHITKCRHTQLDLRYATVQQVRLHDCEYVQVRVGKSIVGIILEHCNDMRFVLPASIAKNVDHIVHDFGWLRRDKPSPNFTVEHYHDHLAPNDAAVAVTSRSLAVVEMTTATGVGIDDCPPDNNHTTTSSSAAGAGGDEKCDQESDDDEL
jgi:hypothetical protein